MTFLKKEFSARKIFVVDCEGEQLVRFDLDMDREEGMLSIPISN